MSREFIILLALSGVVLMFGCTMERVITRPNVKDLPHFSFSAPEDDDWFEEQVLEKSKTVFTARRGNADHQITMLENSILDEKIRQASAKEVADNYRNGEKNDMIERGVKGGQYELSNVTMGQEMVGDKLYYTMKYSTKTQRHCESARLFLYFPREYGNEYFLVTHYSEIVPTCDLLNFFFESDFLGTLRTVTYTPTENEQQDWATPDGTHVFLSDSNKNQGYYFNNDSDRLCFTFSLSGMWKPTKEAGLLMSMDGKKYVGALLRSEEDLKEYKGKDLLARAVTLHVENFEKTHKQPPDSYKVEDFESLFSDSIKWTAIMKFKHRGESYLAEMVRYMAVVKPGWVAVVTASHGTNGDDTARNILESLRVKSEPDCYWPEIRKLRQEKWKKYLRNKIQLK